MKPDAPPEGGMVRWNKRRENIVRGTIGSPYDLIRLQYRSMEEYDRRMFAIQRLENSLRMVTVINPKWNDHVPVYYITDCFWSSAPALRHTLTHKRFI